MAHVTRITAGKSKSKDDPEAKVTHKVKAGAKKSANETAKQDKNSKKTTKSVKTAVKPVIKAEEVGKTNKAEKGDKKSAKAKNSDKKPVQKDKKSRKNPLKAIGTYISGSWHELRQVRWPNRKATWKLVLAVFAYTALFMMLIMLLDALLTFVFNNILK